MNKRINLGAIKTFRTRILDPDGLIEVMFLGTLDNACVVMSLDQFTEMALKMKKWDITAGNSRLAVRGPRPCADRQGVAGRVGC
jgi:hypothetical protein